MPHLRKFLEIAAKIEPQHHYRTVYDTDMQVLLPGKEAIDSETLDDFCRVDFAGKSVVDLGCNFGFFSFQAKRLGADSVLGVDREECVLDGCAALREHFGLRGVDFLACDIEQSPNSLTGRKFDLAMLVEFIGKTYVLQGKVAQVLGFLETLSDKELLVSVQKSYMIRKELGSSLERMLEIYPEAYIREREFKLLEYVRDFYAPRWEMRPVSRLTEEYEKPRRFLRFLKKS